LPSNEKELFSAGGAAPCLPKDIKPPSRAGGGGTPEWFPALSNLNKISSLAPRTFFAKRTGRQPPISPRSGPKSQMRTPPQKKWEKKNFSFFLGEKQARPQTPWRPPGVNKFPPAWNGYKSPFWQTFFVLGFRKGPAAFPAGGPEKERAVGANRRVIKGPLLAVGKGHKHETRTPKFVSPNQRNWNTPKWRASLIAKKPGKFESPPFEHGATPKRAVKILRSWPRPVGAPNLHCEQI